MAADYFGPFGDHLEAVASAELEQKLELIDISVPRKTGGRHSLHRERYCVVLYLLTLNATGRLRFPFRVGRPSRQRPDFLLAQSSECSGLEVTEAGRPELQRARTELERSPPGSLLEGAEIRRPGGPLRGRGRVGDEPEREWTTAVMRAIRKKTDHLMHHPNPEPTDLLVYDNTGFVTLTAWTVDELAGRLAESIEELQRERPDGPHFRSYSVLRDRLLLYDVTRTGGLVSVPQRDSAPRLLPLTRLGVSEEDLRRFSRDHDIRKLAFFGSIQREEDFGPASDVDVLVEFEPGRPVGLIRMAGIERELSELLGRKVDLRTVPELSRYFREEVVRHSEPVNIAG